MDAVLAVDDLRVAAGDRAIGALPSLHLLAGQTACLHGPSGCGKSSLLLALLGLLPAGLRATGSAKIDGVDLATAPADTARAARAGRIAFVMQDAQAALDPLARIGAQMAAATGATAAACTATLRELGEHDLLLDRLPHQISGGQAQRVLLAIARLRRPRLLLLDEPTASLDGDSLREWLAVLRDLQQDLGAALLVATHDRRLLAALPGTVYDHDGGRFVPRAAVSPPWPRALLPVPAGAEPLLSGRGIAVSHGARVVLDGVDLTVQRGEVVAVLGPSGAGKSTLLAVLAGLQRPRAGRVQGPVRRTAVQLLPQNAFASLTPGRTLASLLRESAVPGFDAGAAADELHLPRALLQRTANEMSGGERRRAALLRCLSAAPDVLLLDEPTASLDPATAAAVMATIQAVQQRRGAGVVLVTHDETLAEAVAHRVLQLRGGRLAPAATVGPA